MLIYGRVGLLTDYKTVINIAWILLVIAEKLGLPINVRLPIGPQQFRCLFFYQIDSRIWLMFVDVLVATFHGTMDICHLPLYLCNIYVMYSKLKLQTNYVWPHKVISRSKYSSPLQEVIDESNPLGWSYPPSRESSCSIASSIFHNIELNSDVLNMKPKDVTLSIRV